MHFCYSQKPGTQLEIINYLRLKYKPTILLEIEFASLLNLRFCLGILQEFYFDFNQFTIDFCKTPLDGISRCKIFLNNIPVSKANSQKYLGLHLDSKLSFDIDNKTILTKANRNIGLLRRFQQVSPRTKEIIKLLFIAPCQNIFNYHLLSFHKTSLGQIMEMLFLIKLLITPFIREQNLFNIAKTCETNFDRALSNVHFDTDSASYSSA